MVHFAFDSPDVPWHHARWLVILKDALPYIYIYICISEVGGSEFAFRQAPPDREIVSCRACVRAVWMPSRIPDQILGLLAFPFPFWIAGLSLFPFVIGLPFSLVH